MNFEFLFCCLSLVVSLAYLILNLRKLNRINTGNFLSFLFSLLLVSLSVLEVLVLKDILNWLLFKKYFAQLIIVSHFTFLTLICLLSVSELEKKIVKTLWRLPVIGILVSMFNALYYMHINLILVFIIGFILFVNRVRLRVYVIKILLSSIMIMLMSYTADLSLSVFNIFLVILILLTPSILDAVRVKFIVFENREKN